MGKKILSLDALLLFALVLVRVRIDTLTIAVIPRPTDLVAQVPILGGLLSPEALRLLTDWMADPISGLLITATFGLTLVYLLLDVWVNWPERNMETALPPASPEKAGEAESANGQSAFVQLAAPAIAQEFRGEKVSSRVASRERALYLAKLTTLYLIIFLITGVGTLLVIGLRHVTEPARYAHDGGVLETESAIEYLLAGKNPYVETYYGTPAEKLSTNTFGLSHYVYLPWAFLSGVPFYLAGQAILGWYDQRFVYLIALAITLALVPKLASRPGDKLALVMLVGLNPIMGNDIVYGINDILAIVWVVLAAYWLRVDRLALSAGSMGLAIATKGTVWPILPFYLIYLFRHELKALPAVRLSSLWKLAPLVVTALAVVLPFAIWNFGAMMEDTWSYNMGGATVDILPIKGWGAANIVLVLGWVQQTMSYFPFWIFEGLFALPVLVVLLLRQWRHNTLDAMLLNYGLVLLVFLYFSRTMNPNYVGYALTFVGMGYFGDDPSSQNHWATNAGRASR